MDETAPSGSHPVLRLSATLWHIFETFLHKNLDFLILIHGNHKAVCDTSLRGRCMPVSSSSMPWRLPALLSLVSLTSIT